VKADDVCRTDSVILTADDMEVGGGEREEEEEVIVDYRCTIKFLTPFRPCS
jgi:hypothetical protein